MPLTVISTIAANTLVRQLVKPHRMLRTLGGENETETEIGRRYSRLITFANDLDCFQIN
jgi:hypothetical protein